MTLQKAQQIIQQATTALLPYARNSRTHSEQQIAQIAASIREFWFTNPVLVDDDNGIVAGHGRVLAAQQIGMAEVPTINVGWLTEAQRRAYVIADNQLALNAGWDESVLAQEVAWLNEQNFSTELLGFDADFLDGLLAEEDSISDGLTDQDDSPEAKDNVITQAGDVWLMGKHRVICGSALEQSTWDQLEIEGDAMTFTSPPYGAANVAKLRDHYIPGNDQRQTFYETHDDAIDDWPALMNKWTELAITYTGLVHAMCRCLLTINAT